MARPFKEEYAVYKGEALLCVGTAKECADDLGVKVETIYYYSTPAYKRKVQNRKNKNHRITIKLDNEE